MRRFTILAGTGIVLLVVASFASRIPSATIINGQGDMAGEVTANSVILQSRLTAGWELVDGDLPGTPGVARFEVAAIPHLFARPARSDWLVASADHDFVVKTRIGGLEPNTKYFYRLIYGTDREHLNAGAVRSFRTLAGPGIARDMDFVAVTGMNHFRFYESPEDAYSGPDKALGYPALETIRHLQPDFLVATGDNVYYDEPGEGIEEGPRAREPSAMRKKWHEQFARPRYVDFFSAIPVYWEKDDHDYRYNDCDNTGDWAPAPALGASIFREQVPVVDPLNPDAVTYRTHRISKDLQIWLSEGRDYRSPNLMDNGPGKTLWGANQVEWFKRTMLASDAAFKILISPTPMIGPDDAEQAGEPAEGHDRKKRDNHANPDGFSYERDQLFQWLIEQGFLEKGFYIITGDRHWKYHSIDPRGFEEFSTGALVDGNSRMGRPPGDPDSTDPGARIEQPYTDVAPTGGFIHVSVSPGSPPTATFRFYDERGVLLYETRKVAGQR